MSFLPLEVVLAGDTIVDVRMVEDAAGLRNVIFDGVVMVLLATLSRVPLARKLRRVFTRTPTDAGVPGLPGFNDDRLGVFCSKKFSKCSYDTDSDCIVLSELDVTMSGRALETLRLARCDFRRERLFCATDNTPFVS